MLKTFGDAQLEALTEQARSTPRRRKNFNLHEQLDDPIQRLCNAFEPGTYVRPHRHPQAGRWELFSVLRGGVGILLFDDEGLVLEQTRLSDQGPHYIIEIPDNTWHTVFSLHSGTVLFEVKQGPYEPLSDKDFAPWAPPEGDPQVQRFVDWFARARSGDRPPQTGALA